MQWRKQEPGAQGAPYMCLLAHHFSTHGLVGESQGPCSRRAKLGSVGGRGEEVCVNPTLTSVLGPNQCPRLRHSTRGCGLKNIQETHPHFSQPWSWKTRSAHQGNLQTHLPGLTGLSRNRNNQKIPAEGTIPQQYGMRTNLQEGWRTQKLLKNGLLPHRPIFPALCKEHKESITIHTN